MRYKFYSYFVVLFTIFSLFIPSVLFAEGKVVREVIFVGNFKTSSETISSNISTHAGSRLDKATIGQDIKSLYKLGQFEDIKVESKDLQNGVRITYIFVEKSVIAEVGFEGNKKIKSSELSDESTIKIFNPLDEKDLAKSIENIRNLYNKKGYYLADINYHTEPLEEGEVKFIFDISENRGVIVRRVDFLGNEVFPDDQLRDVIRTKRKGGVSFLTKSGKFDEEQLKFDTMLLTLHYLNHGYLRVKVLPPKVSISKDKRYLFITFHVSEGKQYRIGNLTISGDILTTKEEMLSLVKTKSSDIYSQVVLEEDLRVLTDRYGDEGYAYANVVPVTIPDDEKLTADINLTIDKGRRITIEKINIFGNATTRDKVIRREMKLKENDRYSERLLRESRRRIMQLGYFEEVNFATPRGSQDDTIVINITVKERSTGSFQVGAGFSTVEYFVFTASVSKQNFLGYGISGAFNASLSKKQQMLMVSLKDPYFLDTQWMVGGEFYRNAYHYTDYRRLALGGGVSLGHRFFDNWSADVGYKAEDVEISDFSYAVPQLFRLNASGFTSALSLSLSYDKRDDRYMPRAGFFGTYGNEVSGSKLGGDNDYYRTGFKAAFYEPVLKKKLVFKQYGQIGYIRSLGDKSIPLFERYFCGGPYSLRGYYPNTIGPTIRIPRSPSGGDDEFVYGGDKMLLFIGEIEWWVYERANLSIVGFAEGGNTFAEQENYSLKNLRFDYGVGIRWGSPMGPMRFEFGFPINKHANESNYVFNFTIGHLF